MAREEVIAFKHYKHILKNRTLEEFGFKGFQNSYNRGKNKMATIKESAMSYEPPQTKNITELEKISVNIETEIKTFERKDVKEGEEKTFEVEVFQVDGEEYRLPASVKEQLKAHIKSKPDLEFFKVIKSGEGINTKYTVIPL